MSTAYRHRPVQINAFLWGLQFSFLSPALALLLVSLFDASTGQIAGVLAIYNAACLLTAWFIPRWADRHGDYLRPLLACAVFTIALASVLVVTRTLPLAVAGLVLLGAPAAVGTPLVFGYIRHAGASASKVVNARAMFSLAWVAGPPLATVIISHAGGRALVAAIGATGVLNLIVITQFRPTTVPPSDGRERPAHDAGTRRSTIALVVAAFALLQAANTASVAVTTLFVTQTLHLSPIWGGGALGLAAGLEVPALFLLARNHHRNDLALLTAACPVGVAFYLAVSVTPNGAVLLAAEVLNAAFYAVVAGVGLTLFQSLIRGPGAAAGLLSNAQRVGAMLSGPLIGLGAVLPGGLRAVFVTGAVVTALGLVLIRVAAEPPS